MYVCFLKGADKELIEKLGTVIISLLGRQVCFDFGIRYAQ